MCALPVNVSSIRNGRMARTIGSRVSCSFIGKNCVFFFFLFLFVRSWLIYRPLLALCVVMLYSGVRILHALVSQRNEVWRACSVNANELPVLTHTPLLEIGSLGLTFVWWRCSLPILCTRCGVRLDRLIRVSFLDGSLSAFYSLDAPRQVDHLARMKRRSRWQSVKFCKSDSSIMVVHYGVVWCVW